MQNTKKTHTNANMS